MERVTEITKESAPLAFAQIAQRIAESGGHFAAYKGFMFEQAEDGRIYQVGAGNGNGGAPLTDADFGLYEVDEPAAPAPGRIIIELTLDSQDSGMIYAAGYGEMATTNPVKDVASLVREILHAAHEGNKLPDPVIYPEITNAVHPIHEREKVKWGLDALQHDPRSNPRERFLGAALRHSLSPITLP